MLLEELKPSRRIMEVQQGWNTLLTETNEIRIDGAHPTIPTGTWRGHMIMGTRAAIREFIRRNMEQGYQVDNLGDGDSLVSAGIVDSLSVLILLCHIGEAYGITPDASEISPLTFDSVASIESFIRDHAGAASPSPN